MIKRLYRSLLVLCVLGFLAPFEVAAREHTMGVDLRLGTQFGVTGYTAHPDASFGPQIGVGYRALFNEDSAFGYEIVVQAAPAGFLDVFSLFLLHLPLDEDEQLFVFAGGGLFMTFAGVGELGEGTTLGLLTQLGAEYRFSETNYSLSFDWLPRFNLDVPENGSDFGQFSVTARLLY